MPRTILIVDDLSINRRILSAALTKEYDILEASSGQEALEQLGKNPDSISAVLLDIVMPDMDGYEVLRRIRDNAATALIPVVMITGSEDEESRNRSLALGANDFVMKPYNPDVIRHCLRNNIALRETAATVQALQRDRLTGLYAREAFFEKVQNMVAEQEPGYYIMASFDIDNFKIVNDQYGTQRGDEVLRHIAGVFEEGFKKHGGLCCRLAADDFAVVYPAGMKDGSELAEMRARASRAEGIAGQIVFSIGRYLITDPDMPPSAMYDRAMLAALSVKSRYDNKIAEYDDSMRLRLLDEQEMINEMDEALQSRQFEVWFQPQYNHGTGALIGAEALVRWRHPRRGLIPPGLFIPVFERNGSIFALDYYVMEETCACLRKWLDEGPRPLPVSVNVSRYDVFRPTFISELLKLVNKYAVPIDLLRIEITESAFAGPTGQIVTVVRELISRGFTVEIDDFGSGYSSLNTLKNVPAQILKLDMKFLGKEEDDTHRGGNIIESVVRMTKWLGMAVIAEGVETVRQADYLLSVGCSYVQGYLYAKPMPANEYEALWKNADKEEGLLVLETVENLDNNAFWDPESMDTLIFNSYVGAACIYEYHNGTIELLRATRKYAQVLGGAGLTVDQALKLDWSSHLDEETARRIKDDLLQSAEKKTEVTGEYVFHNLPGCPAQTYLRSTMRVIAQAGGRMLVYCTNDNITDQRRAERREHEIAAEMRLIMENVRGGICATVFDGGPPRILFANDGFYALHGYTRAQYETEITHPLAPVLPEDTQKVEAWFNDLVATRGSANLEYRCVTRDGAVIDVSCNSTVTTFAGISENVVLSVLTDITEISAIRRRAQVVTDQMQAIMDNVDVGIVARAVDGDSVRYLFSNSRYYEILGYTPEEFAREITGPFDIAMPEDRPAVEAAYARVSQTGKPGIVDFRARRRDGEVLWLRSAIAMGRFTGQPGLVQLVIYRNITGVKEAETREHRAAEQFEAILNDAGSGIIAVRSDGDKYDFVFSNERFYAMHGYTRSQYEAEVQDIFAPIHPDDRAGAREAIRQAVAGQAPTQLEYRVVRRDGGVRWVRADFTTTRFSGLAGAVYLLMMADVTDEKEIEARLRDSTTELQAMMNDIPGGFARILMNPDGTTYPVYVNDGLLALLGMTRDDMARIHRENNLDMVHPDDRAMVVELQTLLLEQGEARSSRYRLRRGDGSYAWFNIFGRVTGDAAGNRYINIYYSDATQAVSEERRRQELLDNLPFGAALYEYDGQRVIPVHLNNRYWELVGRSEKTLSKVDFMNAVHPDDRAAVLHELKAAIEEKRDLSCDIRVLYGAAGYRFFTVVGRVVPQENRRYNIYAAYKPVEEDGLSYTRMLPALLSAIMDSTSDLAFAKDINLRYISASKPFARMAGYESAADILGKTDYDLFDKELAGKYRADDERLLADGKSIVNMVETIPGTDGLARYSNTSKYLLRGSDGAPVGLYGMGRDITEDRAIRNQLEMLTNNVSGGIAVYEGTPAALDKIRLTYFNDGFCRLFGYTRAQYMKMAKQNPLGLVFNEDMAGLMAQVANLVRNGVPMDLVYRAKVNGGGYKWINLKAIMGENHGENLTVNAMLFDVTERQKAIEALRISEEEYRLSMAQSEGVIYRYTIADKTMTMPADMAQRTGLPACVTNVPDGPLEAGVISPESAPAYRKFFQDILDGAQSGNVIFRQNDTGVWRWYEAKSSTVFSDNIPVRAVISFFDITERQEKETVYRKWQQSLAQKRQEDYTLFRCNLSRDTNLDPAGGTLLRYDFAALPPRFNERTRLFSYARVHEGDRERYNTVLNADSLLAGYYQGKRSYTMDFRELLPEGGERWLRLTVDLVEYSGSTDVEAYMLYEDIDESKRAELRMKEQAETDPLTGVLNRSAFALRMDEKIAAAPGAIHALLMLDLDGFKQVNDSFGHAAGDQALIDVANSMRSLLRRDDLLGRLGGDEFLVFLHSIPNEDIAEIKARQLCAVARRSFNADVQITGSVGVVMVPRDGDGHEVLYKKVDAAMYHVKGGTKDSFAFFSESMDEEKDAASEDQARPGPVKRRMLVVDDDDMECELLSAMFKNEYKVERAWDGEGALVRLRHYGSAVSVVLLDLRMPGMDGFTVLDKMRLAPETRSIPVIVVSADGSREACMEAVRRGATDFVTKPVDAELLRMRVRSAVSKAENERLRAQNSYLEMRNDERIRYETALESMGAALIEYDWLGGNFVYFPSVPKHLGGAYNSRKFWQILLSDMVADTLTVQSMQTLVHRIAEDRNREEGSMQVRLRTAAGQKHLFRMNVRKISNEYKLTNKLILTFIDLDKDGE